MHEWSKDHALISFRLWYDYTSILLCTITTSLNKQRKLKCCYSPIRFTLQVSKRSYSQSTTCSDTNSFSRRPWTRSQERSTRGTRPWMCPTSTSCPHVCRTASRFKLIVYFCTFGTTSGISASAVAVTLVLCAMIS